MTILCEVRAQRDDRSCESRDGSVDSPSQSGITYKPREPNPARSAIGPQFFTSRLNGTRDSRRHTTRYTRLATPPTRRHHHHPSRLSTAHSNPVGPGGDFTPTRISGRCRTDTRGRIDRRTPASAKSLHAAAHRGDRSKKQRRTMPWRRDDRTGTPPYLTLPRTAATRKRRRTSRCGAARRIKIRLTDWRTTAHMYTHGNKF